MVRIREFAVEQWMNEYEETCRYNLAETCVRSLTAGELLELSGRRDDVIAELEATALTYGPIPGSPRLRALVAGLYERQGADNVLVTHGAIGANALVHASLGWDSVVDAIHVPYNGQFRCGTCGKSFPICG